MPKCLISLALSQDKEYAEIKYNDMLSHRVLLTRLAEIRKESESDLWIRSEIRARELGKELFAVLDGSGGRLRAEMETGLREGQGPEIRLNLPPEWDGLPFELMFHEGFLLLDHEAHIFRLTEQRGKDRKIMPEKRPLKILFMACAPEGVTPLNFEAEEELILRETEKLHLHLEVEDSGSLEGLTDTLRGAGGFDVVHLSGHAHTGEKQGPVFYMEDETGRPDPVTPQRLRRALKEFSPRILFLSGCSTGKSLSRPSDSSGSVPSFTEQMVASGIPFVMGWARPVTDIGATLLAAHLFKLLSLGKDISESVRMARQEVRDVYGSWALFRVYSDATPPAALIPSGMGIPTQSVRKTVYRTLEKSQVRVLEQGFVGRRRQVQSGVKVLRGFFEQKGLLITGAAGVGKSCLAGKLIERFSKQGPDGRKLAVIHGKLSAGELFHKLTALFEQHGISSGLETLHSDRPPEERIMSLFRTAFQELPLILYLDDFEQNLERMSSHADAEDGFVPDSEALPLVRGILRSLAWAEGKTGLIISSRYPFRLEHGGDNLPETQLFPIPLMSMRDADLKKKVEKLSFISRSPHRELYLNAAKGNPRLLEWLDKIAAEEEKYDLTELKIQVQGKTAQYVAEYLFELMAGTEGRDFETFLRKAAVFRQPVPASAFENFGTAAQLKRAAWLTLAEQENPENGKELYRVHPMIREAEWRRLSPDGQKECHEKAAQWYDREMEQQAEKPYGWLTECVWHCLQAGKIRGACYHAAVLGNMMEKMQLYRERVQMQQEVADAVTEEVIAEAMREKDGNVSVLLNNLGQAYKELGDSPNLIRWTEKALETDKGMYGENHERIAIFYNNLGSAYNSLGQCDTAIVYYERALNILKSNYGEQNRHVAAFYNNLGGAYRSLGQYDRAIAYYERALNIFKSSYGEQHPHVAASYNNLGSAYDSLGQYDRAIVYYERALDIDRKNFGDNHPSVAREYNNLGSAYDSLGQYDRAIVYYERALDIDRKNFGENHPKVAIRYNNLGLAYASLGQYDRAIVYYERALDIDRKNFGENHPQIANYHNNLGAAYQSLGQYDRSIASYERALNIFKSSYGEQHPHVASSYNNLGSAYFNLGEYQKAVEHAERTLAIFMQFLGPDHPNTKTAQNNLNDAKKAMLSEP
ncbi:MAG: tetratricopeptide repeat protein [Desulfococcaceae bacterium]